MLDVKKQNETETPSVSNMVQWNMKVPKEKRDEIARVAIGKYSMNVSDYVLMRCLDLVGEPSKETGTVAPIDDNFELEELRANFAKQNSQILALLEDNTELKRLLGEQDKTTNEKSQLLPKNEFGFYVSDDLKAELEKIEFYRAENKLTPIKYALSVLLPDWSYSLYSNFKFKDATGIDYQKFKEIIEQEKKNIDELLKEE